MANNNKHTGPNVPALRFPEFSGEWEKISLQDCCSGFSYGMNAPAKAYDGVNKYIRITDIDESTSIYKSDDTVSPDGLLSDEYLVKENDILFARTGASTGKTYLYHKEDGRLFYAGFLIKANVNNNCAPYFIFSQTKTQSYRRWVEIMSARSGQPGINSQEYASFPLYIPSEKEQEKIALLLRGLDERIIVQSKIIEEQETLLKSLADKLFNTLDTVTKLHLSDISELYQPKTIPLSNLSSKGYPVYGANGIIGSYKNFNHTTEQICIACRGSSCGSVNYTVPKAWITGNAMVVNTDNYSNIIDKRYLYYYLRRINYSSLISGSGQPQIVRAPLANLLIPVPTLEKQKHVVLILETVAKILGTNKIILQHYKNQKAYLLSRMFI